MRTFIDSRLVEFAIVDGNMKEFKIYGVFHQWGKNEDSTVGIIEALEIMESSIGTPYEGFEAGKIYTVYPNNIRFLLGEELDIKRKEFAEKYGSKQ